MKNTAQLRLRSTPQIRRICVQFSGGYPPLFYRADAVTAWAIAAAFARSADPVVTVDDFVTHGLKPFPCQRLFELCGAGQ